jgi:hypothetical protein
MKANDPKEWMKEYGEFLAADIRVPRDLSERVLTQVHELLHPSAWVVFAKLLGIHLVVGFLSLSVCHQFGMNPFGTQYSLADWLMVQWGHSTCMIGCGVLFVGLSFLSAGYFLSIEEVRALRRTEFLQTFSLGAVSLAIFAAFGADVALSFAGLWLLGGLIGGFLATEAVWKLRTAQPSVTASSKNWPQP